MSIDQDRANAFLKRLVKSINKPVQPPTRQEQVKERLSKKIAEQRAGYESHHGVKLKYRTPYRFRFERRPQESDEEGQVSGSFVRARVPSKADRLATLDVRENVRKSGGRANHPIFEGPVENSGGFSRFAGRVSTIHPKVQSRLERDYEP